MIRGVLPITVVFLLVVAILTSTGQIDSPLNFFSKAEGVPSADVCNDKDKIENKIDSSLVKNPHFAQGLSNWTSFGMGDVSVIDSYGIAVPTLQIVASGPFSGGVYQVVDNLKPGTWYHAFYTTAQDEQPKTIPPAIREIGVDLNGGTNSNQATWGARRSGGQPDKDAGKVGGWKTMGNKNNPLITFKATNPKATIFLKASSQSTGNYKVWMDSVYLGEDCNSGVTVNPPTIDPKIDQPAPTSITCGISKIKMSITPQNPKVGDEVTLFLQSSNNSEGTTFTNKTFDGLSNFQTNWATEIPNKIDPLGNISPDVWPSNTLYGKAKVDKLPFTWTHTWKNCAANNCQITSELCSKTFNSQTGEQTTPAKPISAPTAANPAQALKDEFGVNLQGFNNSQSQLAYQTLSTTKNTKFPELLKSSQNTVIIPSQTNLSLTSPDCKLPIQLLLNHPEQSFKYSLIHELGHRIYFCAPSTKNNYAKHDNVFFQEGPVSIYSACPPPNAPPDWSKVEDFAETIAFTLIPSTNQLITNAPPGCNITGKKFSDGANPLKDNSKFPAHFQFAKELLKQ